MNDIPAEVRRLVVLHHTGGEDADHFDLLFDPPDGKGDLLTWRSPTWPIMGDVELVPLRPHRRFYLTYEGPLTLGRGTVHRVADVQFQWKAVHPNYMEILLSDGQSWRIEIAGKTAFLRTNVGK